MKTILVSGASGIVGYGILRSLKGLGYRIIGTTIYKSSPADCFADIVEKPPLTKDEQYIPWLIDTIKRYDIDLIIPGIEADMFAWNKHRKELEEAGTIVLLNRSELIDLCMDKWTFYQELEKHDVKCRIRSSLSQDFNVFPTPFLLKPRCGFGARGIVKVESQDTFEAYRSEIGRTLMMQEFVGTEEEEYTVSAFFDRESKIRSLIAMRRKLSTQGFTEIAEVVSSEPFKALVQELSSIFAPVGPTNFQFRLHEGSWKLLEINPRISSSTSIRTAFGYNESKLSVDYFLQGKEIEQPKIKTGRAVRYVEDYIFYDSNYI